MLGIIGMLFVCFEQLGSTELLNSSVVLAFRAEELKLAEMKESFMLVMCPWP